MTYRRIIVMAFRLMLMCAYLALALTRARVRRVRRRSHRRDRLAWL